MARRVLIDATAIVNKPTGVGKYCLHLIDALATIKPATYEFTVLHQRDLPSTHPLFCLSSGIMTYVPVHVPVVGPKRDAVFFKMRRFIDRHDLLHCLHTYLPRLSGRMRVVVTIHDLKYLVFPELFGNPLKPVYYWWTVKNSVRRANRVIAVSHATKRDLQRRLDVVGSKITVIHEAATLTPDEAREVDTWKSMPVEEPFLLYVGRNRRAKNIARIIAAHHLLLSELGDHCPHLVFVGPDFGNLATAFSGREKAERVRFLGAVDDVVLRHLYRRALMLVYPSLYEGFGLPILEAMAMGVPVVTSDRSSLPEVAGDAAVVVDPYSVAEIAGGILKLVKNQRERERYRELGFRRVRAFSWAKAAKQTLEVYDEVLRTGTVRSHGDQRCP